MQYDGANDTLHAKKDQLEEVKDEIRGIEGQVEAREKLAGFAQEA